MSTETVNDHKYFSPTTKGLEVKFNQYCVELVCLNMGRKLPPNFWRQTYWGKKFQRECIGFSKLSKLHDTENPVIRCAIVGAIKSTGVQTLLREGNLTKLDKKIHALAGEMMLHKAMVAEAAKGFNASESVDMESNAKIVAPTHSDGKLDRLRKIDG